LKDANIKIAAMLKADEEKAEAKEKE